MIFTIAPEHLGAYWPHAEPHLARVADFNAEYELDLLQKKLRQLWLVVDDGKVLAAMTTEVTDEPEKVITVVNAGGRDLDRWQDAFEAKVDAWAADIGATRARVIGRRGWVRRLPHFREVATIVEKSYG